MAQGVEQTVIEGKLQNYKTTKWRSFGTRNLALTETGEMPLDRFLCFPSFWIALYRPIP